MTKKKPRKVGYGHNRSRRDFAHMDIDRDRGGQMILFLDAKGTRRAELAALVDPDAIEPGDVINVCAVSDFGAGAAGPSAVARIEARGATVKVDPPPVYEKSGKRVSKSHPRRWDCCQIWWGVLDPQDKLAAISKILDQAVSRHAANRLCGGSYNPPADVRDQIKAECSAQKS